jgi:hypothetical protein
VQLISALKEVGGVIDGEIQYEFIAGKLETRTIKSIKEKFKTWRKSSTTDKQAQDVFRYVESTKEVNKYMLQYF